MNLRLSILFAFFSALLHSQGGFKRQFKLPGAISNHSKGIYQKPDGYYIAGGIIIDTLQGYSYNRLTIMGLDTGGQLQWTKIYGNYKFEYLSGFGNPLFYFDGNFLYHSGSVRDSLNKYYGVLMKFDLNGDTLWQKTFKDTAQSVVLQMVTKSVDGGLLLSGYCNDPININNTPVLVIKVDSSGGELWRKKINKGFPNDHDGRAILQDSASKKIVIVGYQSIGNISGWWFYDNILILDSLGSKLAQHNFAGPTGGALVDLIQTKDGKFVAVGNSISAQQVGSTNLTRSFAVKFDVNTPNPPIWRFSYDKPEFVNYFTYITELGNGDMLLGGTIDTMQLHNMSTNALIRLTRIDKNGIVKWNKYYNYKTNAPNSDNNIGLWCLNRTADHGFIAAIEVNNIPKPNPFFFVKYDSTGCDSTLAYCHMLAEVGVNEFNAGDISFNLFPNPFTNQITIQVLSTSVYKPTGSFPYNISDLTGRVVKTGSLDTINGLQEIKLKDIPSGMYIFNALIDGRKYSMKIFKE